MDLHAARRSLPEPPQAGARQRSPVPLPSAVPCTCSCCPVAELAQPMAVTALVFARPWWPLAGARPAAAGGHGGMGAAVFPAARLAFTRKLFPVRLATIDVSHRRAQRAASAKDERGRAPARAGGDELRPGRMGEVLPGRDGQSRAGRSSARGRAGRAPAMAGRARGQRRRWRGGRVPAKLRPEWRGAMFGQGIAGEVRPSAG
jgi:hypothetical protein